MVSIIIPVFNSAGFLSRCLDSVLNQTFKNIEVVIIDDGSVDESGKICKGYAEKDARCKVYHQENQGASISRKNGIARATGEWLTFVDSDDIVEDDYIERLFNAIQEKGVRIAACDQVMHVEGTTVSIDKAASVILLDEANLHQRFFHYQFWGFWGKIYHRSVFEDVHFPTYTINEDYVVMAQLFSKYQQMAYVPIGLYHYMVHAVSLSHQPLSLRMFDEYYNKRWVVDFYRAHRPQYMKNAEAQLAETCIKLTKPTESTEFRTEQNVVRQFLRSHILRFLFNPYLAASLKFMALKRCL